MKMRVLDLLFLKQAWLGTPNANPAGVTPLQGIKPLPTPNLNKGNFKPTIGSSFSQQNPANRQLPIAKSQQKLPIPRSPVADIAKQKGG